jgi:hypothetical protein
MAFPPKNLSEKSFPRKGDNEFVAQQSAVLALSIAAGGARREHVTVSETDLVLFRRTRYPMCYVVARRLKATWRSWLA